MSTNDAGAPVAQTGERRKRKGIFDIPAAKRLDMIAQIIERVDHRCMAADGAVTPTLSEMTQAEISQIYALASCPVPKSTEAK